MRSKISKKILSKTSQETKDKVNDYANKLVLSGVMQWVAIEDKLPPVEVDVLVWDEFNIYICNRLDEYGVVWDESTQILDGVTHWIHLPKPPCA